MRKGPAHSEFIKSNTKQSEAFRTGGALRALYSMTEYTFTPKKFSKGNKKMANEKNEMKANETEAVSDEALKDVSGGVHYIEFGGYGATFQMMGESRVRLINGKSCSSCGGTIGKIALITALGTAYSGVKCEKCGTTILETYTDKDIEII